MPVAICNNCNELVNWRNQRGNYIKHQRCKCGSSNLTSVSSDFSEDMSQLIYKDRTHNVRKIVSRDTKEFVS